MSRRSVAPTTLVEPIDTFEGQSALQEALEQLFQLAAAGGHRWLAGRSFPLDDMSRRALANGDYYIEVKDSEMVVNAIRSFVKSSRIPHESVELAVIVKSSLAGVSGVVHLLPVFDGNGQSQMPGRIDLAFTQSPNRYQATYGLPWFGNPLYSSAPTIHVVLVAHPSEKKSPVRWRASKLVELVWSSVGPEFGGSFDVRELTDDVRESRGLSGNPAFYVDVSELSAESTDLSEVRVFVGPDLYHLYQDDGSELMDELFAANLAVEVAAAAAMKLMREAASDGDSAPSLLQVILRLAQLELADPAEVDLQALRSGLQSAMGLVGRTAALWRKGVDMVSEDDDE